MKRTVCVHFDTGGGFSGAVVLDAEPVSNAAEERKSRKHMASITVDPWYYQEFVQELVAAGWYMSEGAKLNFEHQIKRL